MKVHTFYTLTIYKFTEIINSSDLSHLLKKKEELTPVKMVELNTIWESIFYQFVDEVGDEDTKEKLEVLFDIKEIEFEMSILKNCVILYRISSDTDKSVLNQIMSKYGKNLNVNEDEEPQLKSIENYCAGLKTRIAQIKLNHKSIFKKQEQKVKQNVFKESVAIHRLLGIEVNPMTTILPTWIAYRNELVNYKQTA